MTMKVIIASKLKINIALMGNIDSKLCSGVPQC
jgi:hypothetical protein